MAIIVFFILFEITARLLNLYPEYGSTKGMFQNDEVLDYRMTPNFRGKFSRQEFKLEISTNSLGLRDVEYGEKKNNELRILALGDSFVWGAYGTELNQTFVKILERKLNEKSRSLRYQVINAGVPGYGTDQEFLYLKDRGYKLKPDLILVNLFVGNDFLDNVQSGEMIVKNGALFTNKTRIKLGEKIRTFLLTNSHSYRIMERSMLNLFGNFIQKYVRGKIQQDDYQAQLFLKPVNKDITQQTIKTEEVLKETKLYTNSNNMTFVIVLIPLNYQVDNNLKQIFIENNYNQNQQYDMEQPQKIINEWAVKNNVTVIDLLPHLKKLNKDNDFYWKFNPHFNVKGNEIVGDIIYKELTKKGTI
ncbi:hypothetical protein HYX02_00950 [Candidatus Woesearchaeota archaeon]|nr:hypothetical protein [Candidatus Woesearchaeota archaeon]